MPAPLTPSDEHGLETESALDLPTRTAFNIYRVDTFEGAERVGGDPNKENYAGVVFSGYWPGESQPRTLFLRRDNPPMEKNSHGVLKPKGKYLVAKGERNKVSFGSGESVDVLKDVQRPLVMTEGPKKLCALWWLARHESEEPRFVACALSGVWNWKGTIGKVVNENGKRVDEKGVIPDFDRITWAGRTVVILFDSDAATNENVARARGGLMAELKRQKARVVAVDLPALEGLDKTGLDDFLALRGPEAALELIQQAIEAAPSETEVEVERLAHLPPLEYGKARKEAAKRWGVPVAFVDQEVDAKKKQQADDVPMPDLPTVEPARDPVDGLVLADDLLAVLKRYLIISSSQAHALALWILWSFQFDRWGIAPMLLFLSPEKRCGKTSALSLIARLVDRPLFSSNISTAALFRCIGAMKPTLIIDEMDSFSEADESLRGVLNSGHTRAGAHVVRIHGEQMEVKLFSTWSPKVLAAIGTLPDTVLDRSIVVHMRRKKPSETVGKLRWSGRSGAQLTETLGRLASQCKRWGDDHGIQLTDVTPAIPGSLHDRAADNWYPLGCVAAVLGGEWPERAVQAAQNLSGEDSTATESSRIQLLRDIQTVMAASPKSEAIWSQTLCDQLGALEERPWGTWKHDKPITPAQLARQLRPFGVGSRDIRVGSEVRKGYPFSDLQDCLERYISSSPVENHVLSRDTATTQSQSGDSSLLQSATEGACSASEKRITPAPGAGCSYVAAQNEKNGAEEQLTLTPPPIEEAPEDLEIIVDL